MAGRKRKSHGGQHRRRQICLRVSDGEYEMMRRVAAREHVSVARATIELFTRQDGEQVETEQAEESPAVQELRRIRTQIWHIGHNVNQIAHNVNRDMDATMADEHSAANAVEECRRLLADIDRIVARLGPERSKPQVLDGRADDTGHG